MEKKNFAPEPPLSFGLLLKKNFFNFGKKKQLFGGSLLKKNSKLFCGPQTGWGLGQQREEFGKKKFWGFSSIPFFFICWAFFFLLAIPLSNFQGDGLQKRVNSEGEQGREITNLFLGTYWERENSVLAFGKGRFGSQLWRGVRI